MLMLNYQRLFWDGIASSPCARTRALTCAGTREAPVATAKGERFGMAPALQICCDISMDWFKGKSTGKPHI